LSQFPRSLLALWQSLPVARRALLLGMLGSLAGIGVVLYSWSTTVAYVPLYSGLAAADSAGIVEQLRSKNVQFKLETGGSTILVPQSSVDQLRLDFAAQGMPQGGNVGFELMNGNGFTATDFVQRLNFQRGLQGELQRTIESLSAVERARVHIVIPEKSLFLKDQTAPTAAVVLKLKPGQRLDQREVRGVAHLVAGAVEGLKDEQVSILDTSGSVLFDGTQLAAEGFGASASQLEMQQNYQRSVEQGIQQLLDRTLGPGRASVKVAATLNFDRQETTSEQYTPGTTPNATPIARSSSTTTESYKTNGGAGGGVVPGAAANIPGALTPPQAAGGSGSGTDYTRSETTANFEVGKVATKNVQALGGVKRMSISLLLDDKVPEDKVGPLQDAVKAAAGMDQQRGDTIAVGRLPFDRTAIDEANAAFAADASQDQLIGYARIALPILALLIGFLLFRMLVRSVTARSDAYRFLELQGANAPMLAAAASAGALPAAMPVIRALPAPPQVEEARSEMEDRVGSLIGSQPQIVTDVMQAWLKEDM
jgi:flagellar M-ring protein FliF